jgi:hypothetical protein
MTKFKHIALALATAGLLATQAHAGETAAPPLQPEPLAAFSQQDISSLFNQAGQPMQLAALSDVEMRDTEGAWFPFAIYYWGPSIVGAGSWLATSGWRTIPGAWNFTRQNFGWRW